MKLCIQLIAIISICLLMYPNSIGLASCNDDGTCQTYTNVPIKSFGFLQETVCVNDRDEIWTVDLRHAHQVADCRVDPGCQHLVSGQWCDCALTDLISAHQSDPSKKTIVYIHGNRTNAEWAVARGLQSYSNLFNQCSDRTAVRMVIVQWRSEPEIKGVAKDYLLKSQRAVCVGPAFAQLLQEFGEHKPLLLGYSLGTQVILSALKSHPAAGQSEASSLQIVFVAPAIDCSFGSIANNSCLTNSGVNETYVFSNSKDCVINTSKRICSRQCCCYDRDRMLNGTGPIDLGKVFRIDISHEMGKQHSIVRYTESPTLIQHLNWLINQ